MKLFRIVIIAVTALVITAVSVAPVSAQVSLPFNTDLVIDGRDGAIDAGDVILDIYGRIFLELEGSGSSWRLEETRVYVGDEPPANVKLSAFQYVHEGLGGAGFDEFLDLDLRAADINDDSIIYIAVYAEVSSQVVVNQKNQKTRTVTESALAQGEVTIGKGKNQISYFSIPVSG